MLKVFLIQRTDEIGYDEYDGWVVVAKDKRQAFTLVKWGDASSERIKIKTRVIGLTAYAKPRIILSSFNAG